MITAVLLSLLLAPPPSAPAAPPAPPSAPAAPREGAPAAAGESMRPESLPPEWTFDDRRAGGDDAMRFFQFGPPRGAAAPKDGWGVLLILPGGTGSADFRHFCGRIAVQALPAGFIAVELVAPAWSNAGDRVVWPTRFSNPDKARFTAEAFIDAVVKDLRDRLPVDPSRVLALAWSSSGPALYADLLRPESPVRGWTIAMSVFRPQWFGDEQAAVLRGRRVHLLHGVDDRGIPIDRHARKAEARLRELGVDATLVVMRSGHGWTDDPFGRIRGSVEWLVRDPAAPPPAP